LLLTLLCLAYEETGKFPQRKSELYKEALEALLVTWDSGKRITRDIIYRDLSLTRKRQMFALIAAETFERKWIYFPQEYLENKIIEYLSHLPTSERKWLPDELDGQAILRGIVSQHGIFVERAHLIFSFSHLTFQEFFTANYFIDNAAFGTIERLFKNYLLDDQWREVILLVASLLDNPDNFFLTFRQSIVRIIEDQDLIIQKLKQGFANADEEVQNAELIPHNKRGLGSLHARSFGYRVVNELNPHLEQVKTKSERFTQFDTEYKRRRAQILSHLTRDKTANFHPLRLVITNVLGLLREIDHDLFLSEIILKTYGTAINLSIMISPPPGRLEELVYKVELSKEVLKIIQNYRTEMSDIIFSVQQDLDKLRGKTPSTDFVLDLDNTDIKFIGENTRYIINKILQRANYFIKLTSVSLEWKLDESWVSKQYEYIQANQLFLDCLNLAHVTNIDELIGDILPYKSS